VSSISGQRPTATASPPARARAAIAEASRVLPMPGSPEMSSTPPLPAAASRANASPTASSRRRPTKSSGPLGRGPPCSAGVWLRSIGASQR